VLAQAALGNDADELAERAEPIHHDHRP
jgi:hypothetical protein